MATDDPPAIVLTLRDIDELFVAPEPDPMRGHFRTVSGLDEAAAALRVPEKGRPIPTALRLRLPADRVEPGLDDRVRAALGEYCAVRVRELDRQQALVREQGWRELRFGVVFLAACLLASGFLAGAQALPERLGSFLSEGFVIVGWIALWHPVDMLLFETWPLARDRRILETLRGMAVEIEAIGRRDAVPAGSHADGRAAGVAADA